MVERRTEKCTAICVERIIPKDVEVARIAASCSSRVACIHNSSQNGLPSGRRRSACSTSDGERQRLTSFARYVSL